jgi:hypothetical protein
MRIISFLIMLIIACSCLNNKGKFVADDNIINKSNTNVDTNKLLSDVKLKENRYFQILEISKIEYDSILNLCIFDMLKYEGISNMRNNIELYFENGKSKKYRNIVSDDETENVTYTYYGLVKPINSYLILVNYYETGSYLLVNAKNGKEFKIWNKPLISPDKKRIITFADFLGYDEMPNGIQLLSVDNNYNIKQDWEYRTEEWKPIKLSWINDSSLLINYELSKLSNDSNEKLDKYGILHLLKGLDK